jgi:1,4-alpha-glucan branching enzyme
LVKDLNRLYREHPALWAEDFDSAGFAWIDANDSGRNLLSYLRREPGGQQVAVVVNFAGTPHEGYRLALPHGGDWLEILNTDSPFYGGSGVGNLGRVRSEEIPWSGLSHSAQVRIPPLGAVLFAAADH